MGENRRVVRVHHGSAILPAPERNHRRNHSVRPVVLIHAWFCVDLTLDVCVLLRCSRRRLRAQAGFLLAVDTATHNSDRQQPGIAKANDRRLLLRTRVPFRAWKTKFMEISHRETVHNRRVCIRPLGI
jgi:hypothetical protein